MQILVREETPADIDAIRRIHTAAFETDSEARIVDALRAAGGLLLSLVADSESGVVGHIAFSPVVLTTPEGTAVPGIGLVPAAVAPECQRAGIGRQLISEGLRKLRADGHLFCVVVGHAEYYPRQGFVRASTFGIRWEKPVADEAFFVQELAPHALEGISGVVRYRPEFDG